eukprot:TRINITY_DN6143_c1_g1_i1.p1 TRINITY_DN6143_c1_g1~~TRINITY_DN6143_c1_g1_i1.p1  ORF type:complete len:201 (-),score=62.59 TRINITY_DN6143_c1_g1_i1:223-825(-)
MEGPSKAPSPCIGRKKISSPISNEHVRYSRKVKSVVRKLNREFDVNEKVLTTNTGKCLTNIISKGDRATFDFFIDQCNADVNGAGSILSPLYVATDMENLYFCRRLLEKGASMLRKNNDSLSDYPLNLAIQRGPSPLLSLYLKHISKIEKKSVIVSIMNKNPNDSPYKPPKNPNNNNNEPTDDNKSDAPEEPPKKKKKLN